MSCADSFQQGKITFTGCIRDYTKACKFCLSATVCDHLGLLKELTDAISHNVFHGMQWVQRGEGPEVKAAGEIPGSAGLCTAECNSTAMCCMPKPRNPSQSSHLTQTPAQEIPIWASLHCLSRSNVCAHPHEFPGLTESRRIQRIPGCAHLKFVFAFIFLRIRKANSLPLSELLGLASFENRVQLHIAYY